MFLSLVADSKVHLRADRQQVKWRIQEGAVTIGLGVALAPRLKEAMKYTLYFLFYRQNSDPIIHCDP